jgi:c-di-GMP-binding flagellar brake protein YcgR
MSSCRIRGDQVDPVIEDYVDHFEIGFEQFKLKPGLDLELHDAAGKLLPHKAQFVMALPGKGVLVSLQVSDPAQIALQPGAHYQISGFNGKFDFAFRTEALKVDRSQFTAMLAAPASVTINFVRKHARTDLRIPAVVSSPRGGPGRSVTVRNLSVGGAAVSSVQPLGARGEPVMLQLEVMFENRKELLKLPAVVRRSGTATESLMYDTGLEFVNPSRTDKLLLYYYLSTLANEYAVI